MPTNAFFMPNRPMMVKSAKVCKVKGIGKGIVMKEQIIIMVVESAINVMSFVVDFIQNSFLFISDNVRINANAFKVNWTTHIVNNKGFA